MHVHLTCYHAPPAHAPGDFHFFSSVVVYSHPRAHRRRQFLTPELLIDLIIRFVWVYLLESNSDFCTMENERFLKFYKRFLEFIER